MTTPRKLDDKCRERIQTSLDESLLVEAAAGTGKTTQLVGRLVAILASGKTEIGEIVAVTFTRKAAGELSLRLRQELDLARTATDDPAQRENLEAAIARMEEARIGTIHSFCADVLRQRPVEAGVDPDFVELTEEEAPLLYHRAFQNWIEHHLEQMSEGLRRALSRLSAEGSRDSPIARLRDAGFKLVEWRDFPTPWRREPFDRTAALDKVVEELLEVADLADEAAKPNDGLRLALGPVTSLAGWIRRAEQLGVRDDDSLEARLIQLLRDLNRGKWRKGYGSKFSERLTRADMTKRRDQLLASLEAVRRDLDADLAPVLRDELAQVVDGYEELKERNGALDFADLLLKTRDLVRNSKEVRRYLQGRYSHIFVDEFQDTDPIQTELILLLTADDPEESDWRKVRPVPGKLFLVGDPKQSIYRFRRADVVLYQEVKRLLAEAGVGILNLTRSFRSLRPLQEAINAAFAPEMTGDNVTGTIAAGSKRESLAALADQALFPLQVKAAPSGTPRWQPKRRPAAGVIASTLTQLADLLKNGVPLLAALDILSEQATHPTLAEVLLDVRDQVSEGESLDLAMAAHPKVFDELTVSVVRAGSEGAFLEESLERTANFLEVQQELKSRVTGAMIYPVFLAGAGFLITTILIVFFVPKFAKLDPKDVAVGRGRAAAEARKPYIDALSGGPAGKIELERGEKSAIVKRRLQEASRETGIKIRSSWEDKTQRALLWKRTSKR